MSLMNAARRCKAEAQGICERCKLFKYPTLQAHHVLPRCRGGSDARSNLMAVCPPCHAELDYEAGVRPKRGQMKFKLAKDCALCGDRSRKLMFQVCKLCRNHLHKKCVSWVNPKFKEMLKNPPQEWYRSAVLRGKCNAADPWGVRDKEAPPPSDPAGLDAEVRR